MKACTCPARSSRAGSLQEECVAAVQQQCWEREGARQAHSVICHMGSSAGLFSSEQARLAAPSSRACLSSSKHAWLRPAAVHAPC